MDCPVGTVMSRLYRGRRLLQKTLFDYAGAQFKEVKTFFFHNTIYDTVWRDAARYRQPVRMAEMARLDPESPLLPGAVRWLMDEGIGSVSLNPDSVISTWLYLAGQGEDVG